MWKIIRPATDVGRGYCRAYDCSPFNLHGLAYNRSVWLEGLYLVVFETEDTVEIHDGFHNGKPVSLRTLERVAEWLRDEQ